MRCTFRAGGGSAEGTIGKRLNNIMGAVAVINRAHLLEGYLAACRAGCLINNMVTGMALIPPLVCGYIIEAGKTLHRLLLFVSQVHAEI